MDISETLIGPNMNAHPECLGIYIGLDELYVAQTAKSNRGIVLESLVRVPISSVDRTLLKPLELNESFFAMDNWIESLGKVMTKKKWKTNRVVVSLAPSFCLLRHFVIPTMLERKLWKTSIPLQARKYIHFPFEKAEYAYHVYEFETATTKQKRLGVVFTMTTKVILDRLRKGLKSCGLELVSVETSSLSLARIFNESDKEAIGNGGRIYSFFGKEKANFVFLNQSAPVLLREVEISGSIPAERRRFEITNCTEFIAKQLEKDPFEEAVITGLDVDQWITALETDSKKPVRKWNLGEVYGIATRSAAEIAAVGASIKFFDLKTPDIDFTKGKRLSAYEFNASLTAWKIVVIVAALFLLLIIKNIMGVTAQAMKFKKAERGYKTTVADFKNWSASQIQGNLDSIKTQNQNLEKLVATDHLITPLLVEMVDSMPREMWVTKMSYADPFPGNKSDARSLTIEGYIRSGKKDGREDMAIGNQFREAFIKKPTANRICGASSNIRFPTLAGTGSQETTSSIRGRKAVEQNTRFVFTCSRGKGGR